MLARLYYVERGGVDNLFSKHFRSGTVFFFADDPRSMLARVRGEATI